MKIFLLNITLFFCLFLALNAVPRLLLNPYYGNLPYKLKYEYFEKNIASYNTIVLGSSRLYRHVNPRILAESFENVEISTFNLAAPHTFNPETYYLYEKLLKNVEYGQLKHAILELQEILPIGRKNIKTIRNYYWHNLRYLDFAIHTIISSNRSPASKIKLSVYYVTSYFYRLTNGLNYKSLQETLYSENAANHWLGRKMNGYYTLEEHMEDLSYLGNHNPIKTRLENFDRDTSGIEKRKIIAKNTFARNNYKNFSNNAHLDKLLNLIEMSKRKGIHLVFVIPPKLNRYNELLALKQALPPENIVVLADPGKYPNLYSVEHSFDVGHYNSTGADLFTTYLAQALKENGAIN